ncbi:MAG: 2-hydroxychromene-2-carboxylate isomerase [Burkholderiales bacterium]|nr:2-hydroxychromene-2-carboxylate isomerase [Burkholderiales bacterium]
MSDPIDFYFDFSSPYGYLASARIDALAARHGRRVRWNPVLLGVAFKAMGSAPIAEVPMKGEYSRRDFARSARFHGLAYREPSHFPIATVAAARAFYWMRDQDDAAAKRLAHALFEAYFVRDVNIGHAGEVVAIGAAVGIDPVPLKAALEDQSLKDRLKREIEASIGRGVFGSPFVIADGEPFWGVDRFDQLDRWLETGGF